MSWHRIRLVLAAVVFGLVAAACGGGNGDDQEADPSAETFSPDEATARTDEQKPDQPDTAIRPEQIRLGDRFEVCAKTQAVWDAFDNERLNYEAARSALRDAQTAYESATDELDRAAAQEAIDEARNAISRAEKDYESAKWEARNSDLNLAFHAHRGGNTSTIGIVRTRAWEAFLTEAAASTLATIAAYEEAEAAGSGITAAQKARLEEALEQNIANNTPAYIAFRLSFQESCQ